MLFGNFRIERLRDRAQEPDVACDEHYCFFYVGVAFEVGGHTQVIKNPCSLCFQIELRASGLPVNFTRPLSRGVSPIRLGFWGKRFSADYLPYPVDKVVPIKRFKKIVIRSETSTSPDHLFLFKCRKHNDLWAFLDARFIQAGQNLQSIEIRHDDVEEDNVRLGLGYHLQSLDPVIGRSGQFYVVLFFQHCLDDFAQVLVVLDD